MKSTTSTTSTTMTFALGMTLLAYACGGSDGPGTGPVTSAAAQADCQAICEAGTRCGDTQPVAECTTECTMSIDGWVRADALATIADCATDAPCLPAPDMGLDADECFSEVSILQVHRDWATKCNMQLASCGIDLDICVVEGTSGDEGIIRIFAPVVVSEMITCLDNADCNSRLTCLQGVFQKYGIDG